MLVQVSKCWSKYIGRSFPVCVWVSSVAQSCATKDANNKDCVCKSTIPAGINCPPPSKTISPITRFGTIETRLAKTTELLSVSARDPVRECLFYIGWRIRKKSLKYRRGAKSHRWEDSWSDWTGRRSDPTSETSEPALRTPSTGVEATPRRARGSSCKRE